MDDKILAFIKSLKKQLEGIPGEEADVAVGYYEEYLIDAAEAGKNMDEMLLQLGSPEKVASEIKAEASIKKAERSPGIINFVNAMRYAFNGISTPLTFIFRILFVCFSYILLVVFFAGALAALVCALYFAIMTVVAFTQPQAAGTLEENILMGILLAVGLCLLAIIFYRLGRIFIRLSAKTVRRMQNKPVDSFNTITTLIKEGGENG